MGALLWISHHLGIDDESTSWYAFWSGSAGELGWLGLGVIAWRHLVCHEPSCHRFSRHGVTIDGQTYRVCGRHSPHDGNGTGKLAHRFHAHRSKESGPIST